MPIFLSLCFSEYFSFEALDGDFLIEPFTEKQTRMSNRIEFVFHALSKLSLASNIPLHGGKSNPMFIQFEVTTMASFSQLLAQAKRFWATVVYFLGLVVQITVLNSLQS